MKKEVIVIILLFVISVSAQEININAGILPDSPFYVVDTTIDNLRINFANEENKAAVAIDVHNERIAEAQELTIKGKTGFVVKAISEADSKIKVVQEEITPEVSNEVKVSTRNSVDVLTDLKEKVPEEALKGIENALDQQIVEEKKTEIKAEITSKIDQLCSKLIELVGLEEAIKQEPKCDPEFEKSPKWLKRKVNGGYKEFDENAKKKFFSEMSICFDDPRECRCNEIPIKSFSNTCHKIIPHVIRCQYEHDEKACERVEEISGDHDMMEDLPEGLRSEIEEFFKSKEKEAFERFAPRECVSAGARTREACMRIMMEKYMPQECKEAGATTREECERVMREKFGGEISGEMPSECQRDGKFIGVEECKKIMLEKYLPNECKEAGAFTRESCETIMISKHAPEECIEDGNYIGRERCEEIMIKKYESKPVEFNAEEAMKFCLKEKSMEECMSLIKRPMFEPTIVSSEPLEKAREVISELERNPEVERVESNFDRIENKIESIPSECSGLTKEECIKETGKTFVEEIPKGVVFKDGEVEPITNIDIENIVEISEKSVEEININEVRESIVNEVVILESSAEILEQTEPKEAAAAIESGSEGEITGSVVLDVLRLMQKLK